MEPGTITHSQWHSGSSAERRPVLAADACLSDPTGGCWRTTAAASPRMTLGAVGAGE
ncbi:MAG: hypothetical protein OXU70_06935 [Gammaproteobacteria bacterium]|nr:hypothetical protein [Gammaproteobacteria bacterium]